MMNIFISWSGDRSRQIAELFTSWIQGVIQATKPWISTHNIDRGALWFPEISKTLAGSQFGIICLTPENKIEPWILFEAGALAKGIEENRVCTLLIEIRPTDVGNPLAQFNHTIASNKDSMWELVQTLNKALLENKLNEKVLKNAFDTYWEQFIKDYNEIIKRTQPEERVKKRSNDDILAEILTTVRTIDKKLQNNDSYSNKIIAFEEPDQCLNPQVINTINNLYNKNKLQKDKDKLIQLILAYRDSSNKEKKEEISNLLENYIISNSTK